MAIATKSVHAGNSSSARFGDLIAELSLGGHFAEMHPRIGQILIALLVNYDWGKAATHSSLVELATRCGCSRDTIIESIDELEDNGFIVRIKTPGKATSYLLGARLVELENGPNNPLPKDEPQTYWRQARWRSVSDTVFVDGRNGQNVFNVIEIASLQSGYGIFEQVINLLLWSDTKICENIPLEYGYKRGVLYRPDRPPTSSSLVLATELALAINRQNPDDFKPFSDMFELDIYLNIKGLRLDKVKHFDIGI